MVGPDVVVVVVLVSVGIVDGVTITKTVSLAVFPSMSVNIILKFYEPGMSQ